MRFQFTEYICKVYYHSQVASLNWLLPEYGMYKSHRNGKQTLILIFKKKSSISKELVQNLDYSTQWKLPTTKKDSVQCNHCVLPVKVLLIFFPAI